MLKRTAFLTLVAALALPAAAHASITVTHDGTTTTIVGDGDDDSVTAEYTFIGTPPISGNGFRITNSSGVTPGPGCVPEGTSAVLCPEGNRVIDARLGDGSDGFEFSDPDYYYPDVETDVQGQGGGDDIGGAYRGTIDGGAGDDTVRAFGYGAQSIVGGAGNDTAQLSGYDSYVVLGDTGAGSESFTTQISGDVERVRGSEGSDYIAILPNGGSGHTIEGGGGYDTVTYNGSDPVKVTIGGTGTDTIGSDVESVSGGNGDDELIGTGAANSLHGNGGNDRVVGNGGEDGLFGGSGDDTLDGGAGDDVMAGAAGNDVLDGGPGEETLAGGDGGDVLRGGGDKDTVSYSAIYAGDYYYDEQDYGSYAPPGTGPSETGVSVSLDGVANDGTTGEGDNVAPDIEVLQGTAGDDTLAGGPGDNEILGGSGNDRIDGGDGADKIHGGPGDDILGGGIGNDELRGGGDDDQIDGGPGEDLAIGQDDSSESGSSESSTSSSGQPNGVDLIEVRDGERDAVACPAGLSRVLADQHDVVDQKCALVERFTLGPPGAPPPPPVGPSPLLRIQLKGTVIDRRGIARIRAKCAPAPVPCAGRLSLFTLQKRKLRRLGRTEFAVPAGRTRVIRVKLNKRGRKLARRRRSIRTQVFVAPLDPKAKPIRVATVGLRRARR